MAKFRKEGFLLIVMLLAPALLSYGMAWWGGAPYMAWWGHTILSLMAVVAIWELLSTCVGGKTLSKFYGQFLREHPRKAVVWLIAWNLVVAVGLSLHLVAMR